MDNFTVILTSTVVSAVVTSAVNYYMQRNNYRNDYFKKVLEYRMKAYEQVSELLNMFPFRHQLEWGDHEYIDKLGEENFHQILKTLESLVNNGYWLSNEMGFEIGRFYRNVASFYDEFNGTPNDEVIKMAKYSSEIKSFKSEVLLILYRDMENLYNVSAFFRKKKNG